jgi:hypothetical protein
VVEHGVREGGLPQRRPHPPSSTGTTATTWSSRASPGRRSPIRATAAS